MNSKAAPGDALRRSIFSKRRGAKLTLLATASLSSVGASRRFCLLVFAACVLPWLCGVRRDVQAVSVVPAGQQISSDQLESYRRANPVVEWSNSELTKAMPELKGFEPAESQESLPLILHNVGENVQGFFHNFLNTASVEEIHQIRMSSFGPVQNSNYLKVNYLLVALPGRSGLALQEYRTDNKGKAATLNSESGEFLLTSGFASTSIVYFHPKYQPLATFKFLGRKMLNARATLLVMFAQHPEMAAVMGRFKFGEASLPVLVQGVAWIDSASYEILRIRTDLLAPLSQVYLEQATTDILFEEVRFKELHDAMWLPHEVNVTVKLAAKTYHNQHRYSQYKLFNVAAGDKPIENSTAPRPR